MNISVIGTGYVGLVTGSVFADLGNEVTCIDRDEAKVEGLLRGVMPIYEPGLEEMVTRNVADGRLEFTSDAEAGIAKSDVIFLCVGTPPTPAGDPDMSQVEDAARTVARALNRYKVIVNKSTVPVGTGELVREIILTNGRRAVDFDIVSNPEFLREGSAIADTLNPERIVIGAPNQVVAMKILELYAPLERPMLITDVASAEMIKYASNAFLATKISFINSIANICESVGADVLHVMKGMGYDSRIGGAFLQAGLGYGGSCLPKDTLAVIRTAEKSGYDFGLLKAVVQVNQQQVPRFLDRMERALDGLAGRTIGVLGLAFKSNTDDLREAKSLEVISRLLASGATVRTYDPIAMSRAKEVFPQIFYGENAYDAAAGADGIIVVTDWNEFKQLNLDRLKQAMRGNVVFDGRNIYDPARMRRCGFVYEGIGRPGCSQVNGQAAANGGD